VTTPKSEFLRRIVSNIRFQRSAISIVVDWVVALYFIVPGLLIGGYFYLGLWSNPPAWLGFVPVWLLAILLGTAAISGATRYFIQAGDQLFMIYNRTWIRAFTKYGLAYSFSVKLLVSLLFGLLLLPAWRLHAGFTIGGFVCLVWVAAAWGLVVQIAIEKWSSPVIGWRRKLRSAVTLMISIALYTVVAVLSETAPAASYIAAIAVTIGAAGVMRRRLSWTATYMFDAEREYRMKMRLASAFMRDVQGFKAPSVRKRPFLFRRSQRLFRKFGPENGVAETLIKSFYRSGSQLKSYLQLTFAGSAGMLLAPLISKVILLGLVVLLLALWMRHYCKQAMNGDFMMMFGVDDGVKMRATAKAAFWNSLPASVLLGVVFGAAAFGWLGALAMLAIAPAVCKTVTGIVCSF